MSSRGFSLLETVIFIVLAAVVIPIFYLTTQPVIKDMMTPTSYIKARFIAERKMEELMACTFNHTSLNPTHVLPSAVTTDTAFPSAEYAGYQWQWEITYFGCGPTGGSCYNNPSPVLATTVTPTSYKRVAVTVQGPQGIAYSVFSAITERY